VGQAARATAESASAFGQYAEASGAYSTALGQQATASANNSVALGYLSEADRDNSVSVGQSGAERQIVHVAAGTEDTDAVNVSQLKGVSQNFSSQINSVRQDSERGDALNAALSALQPASYDPYRPTQIMAGAGLYQGHSAVALGVSHYTSENTLVHMGFSSNGDSLMANAGVTWKVGPGNKSLPSRYQAGPIGSVYVLQGEVESLRRENGEIRQENAELREQIRQINEKLNRLP
jgi:autotransporter adhesin